jgi:hypothetical protein
MKYLSGLFCLFLSFGLLAQQATTYPRTANTATDLANIPIPVAQPTVRMVAVLLGTTSVGDGNSGNFYWDYSVTNAADGFNYFTSTNTTYASAGRWVRFAIVDPAIGQVAAPVFAPVSGSFASTVNVTITTATSGADIYYTNDGSTPTSGSTLYSGAIVTSATTTYKAIGIKSGMSDSSVTSKTYTKSAAAQPVYWGPSSSTVLDEAGILALANTANETDFFRTYAFGGTVSDYFYWWSPATFAVPRITDGFYLAPFPVSMATNGEGFTDGPTNGWYYLNVTVNGVAGRLYRSFFQIGSGSTQNIVVQ